MFRKRGKGKGELGRREWRKRASEGRKGGRRERME